MKRNGLPSSQQQRWERITISRLESQGHRNLTKARTLLSDYVKMLLHQQRKSKRNPLFTALYPPPRDLDHRLEISTIHC